MWAVALRNGHESFHFVRNGSESFLGSTGTKYMDGLGIHGHGGAKKKGWGRGQIAPHEGRGSGVYAPYDEGEMKRWVCT